MDPSCPHPGQKSGQVAYPVLSFFLYGTVSIFFTLPILMPLMEVRGPMP